MVEAATIPGLSDLQNITPMLREFGVSVTVLFVILFCGLAAVWVFIFNFGKKLDDLRTALTLHCQSTENSVKNIVEKMKEVSTDLQILANSQKILIEQAYEQTVNTKNIFDYFMGRKKKKEENDDDSQRT